MPFLSPSHNVMRQNDGALRTRRVFRLGPIAIRLGALRLPLFGGCQTDKKTRGTRLWCLRNPRRNPPNATDEERATFLKGEQIAVKRFASEDSGHCLT